jgi:YbgC/YbaW family acyl-CoA thioester hydrolase
VTNWHHINEYPIYIHHTDLTGTVHYSKYLELLEQARTDCFIYKELDDSIAQTFGEGKGFVIRNANLEYLAPMTVTDVSVISTRIGRRVGVKVPIYQNITVKASGFVACNSTIDLVFVDFKTGRPSSIPKSVYTSIDNVSESLTHVLDGFAAT